MLGELGEMEIPVSVTAPPVSKLTKGELPVVVKVKAPPLSVEIFPAEPSFVTLY